MAGAETLFKKYQQRDDREQQKAGDDSKAGARALENRRGTAPGIALKRTAGGGSAAGPRARCGPCLRRASFRCSRNITDKVIVSPYGEYCGLGESNVESQLKEQMVEMTNPSWRRMAKIGEVRLRVTASAKSEEEAEDMIAPVTESFGKCSVKTPMP